MKKDFTDELRSLTAEEAERCGDISARPGYEQIKARAFEKAGLRAAERKTAVKRKFGWKKMAALAACVCLIICGAVFAPGLLKGAEPSPTGIRGGIRSEFSGLRELKDLVVNDNSADAFTLLVSDDINMPAGKQAEFFASRGMKTDIAADGSLFIVATKQQIAELVLPENMQFTHFRIIRDGVPSHFD